MLGGKALGYCNGFVILDLAREPATPLGIRKPLALQCQLSLGTGDGFLDFADRDFGVDEGFTHLARERTQVGGTCGSIQGSAERVPQALEQGPPFSSLSSSGSSSRRTGRERVRRSATSIWGTPAGARHAGPSIPRARIARHTSYHDTRRGA